MTAGTRIESLNRIGPRATRRAEIDLLMVAVLSLCCLGLVMAISVGVGGGHSALASLQSHGAKVLAGLVAFLVCVSVPLGWFERAAWPAYLGATGMCWITRLFPHSHGAHRWIKGGGYSLQPVELARFALVLLLARLLVRAGLARHGFRHGFLPTMAATATLALGLVIQPDLGNAALTIALGSILALVGGVRFRFFAIAAVLGVAVLGVAALGQGYAQQRIATFLAGGQSAQVSQSVLAISAGGPFGVGLGDGWMKMGFVPESRNDFVFAIVGEELGYAGSAGVVLLFSMIGYVGYRLSLTLADPFARLLVFGFTFAICVQAAINLMVVTGMVPPKGIDLPFVSSGGTNLVFCLAAIGVVGNAARSSALVSEPEET